MTTMETGLVTVAVAVVAFLAGWWLRSDPEPRGGAVLTDEGYRYRGWWPVSGEDRKRLRALTPFASYWWLPEGGGKDDDDGIDE